MSQEPDVSSLVDQLSVIAGQAGRIILEASDIEAGTTLKEGHANFLTFYDTRVQEYLHQSFNSLIPDYLPGFVFIGEEDGLNTFPEEARHGYAFVVDPIDGTTNFVSGYRPSVTSIALLKDGTPYIAVIYNPYDDLLLTAVRGGGAFLNGKPIHTSEKGRSMSLVAMGSAPYNPELFEYAYRCGLAYQKEFLDIRRSGASVWELCLVAMGAVGLFYEQILSLWDYAAGSLIIEEAGGTVTDLSGLPLHYDGPASIVAASQGIVRESLETGRGYLPDDLITLTKPQI